MRKAIHKVCVAAAACALALVGSAVSAQQINVNVGASQQPFNRGVFGTNADIGPYISEGYGAAYNANLALLNNTSYRGAAGGFWAESYDWRTRDKVTGPLQLPGGGTAHGQTTLELMRNARDSGNSNLILTVNSHGLGTWDGVNNVVIYNDTSTATLTQLASDWVRYTNHIVQTYRQGDTITDPEDLRILNSLSWGGPDFRDDLLLAPGEAPVPKVTYWEIGNEVNHRDDGDTGDAYRARYHAITTAMTAIDNSIKVGPNVTGQYQSGTGSAKDYLKALLKPVSNQWERVDFVSYHPYDNEVNKVDDTNHAGVSSALKNLWTRQDSMRQWAKDQINQNLNTGWDQLWNPKYYPGRASVELLATEWNPSTYSNAYTLRQWNALGIVETAMNMAQNGLSASNFWLWPANIYDGEKIPQYKAMEALSKYGGDTLVSSYQSPNGNSNARLYITQDSETGTITVWGMNMLFGDPGDQAITLTLSLNNLGIDPGQITLMRLADTTGPTTLFSSGTGTWQNWTSNVDWITTDMTGMGLQSFDFTINPAELQLLVIHPMAVPEPGTMGLVLGGMALMALKRRRGR
jgi:hypothetical protein